jgi:hypothetical protein
MSVFDFPRIHFWGSQRVNPGTGNNNSLGPGEELTVTSDSEKVQPVKMPLEDAAFVRWMEGADPHGLVRSQWNYYGDMGFRFDDVRVISAVLAGGKVVLDDPLIGAQVSMVNALVCDLDPEGFDSTQIFTGGLQIRAPGAIGGTGTFHSRRPTRAVTRGLNWYRNVSFHGVLGNDTSGGAGGASASFIHSVEVAPIDKEKLTQVGPEYDEMMHHWWPLLSEGQPASRAAHELYQALGGGFAHGLQIRYNLYLCYPRIADSALVGDFAAGRKTENPAIGWVLGTIAPWRAGEPESLTLGRGLNPARSYPNQYRNDFKPYFLAPAVARVHDSDGGTFVSIDLVNTLPEDGKDGEKFPLGPVELGLRRATAPGGDPAENLAPVTPIGTIPNDRLSFERCGGMYDLPVTNPAMRAALADPGNELVLQTGRFGVLMYEPEYYVGSDCEAAYLDAAPPGSADRVVRPPNGGGDPLPQPLRGWVPVHVWRRGHVPDDKVRLDVEEWKFTPTGDPANYGSYRFPTRLGEESIEVERGLAPHLLKPKGGPGVSMFRYVAPGQWPQPVDGAALAHTTYREAYTFLRVLPYDDEAVRIADADLDYDAVYRHVFRYYALILPAMTKRLDMTVDGAGLWQTPTAARYLLKTTGVDMWEHWAYMPRTRDLSATRRDLLRRYCRKILAAHGIAADC